MADNLKLLVGAPLAIWKIRTDPTFRSSLAWLGHAKEWADNYSASFLLALELDHSDDENDERLRNAVVGSLVDAAPGAQVVRYMIDLSETDGRDIGPSSRLVRICTGRNLITDHAIRFGYEWILHLDTDVMPPQDALERLFEVADLGYKAVGFNVGAYALDGPKIELAELPDADIRKHWNTAGALLVHRDVFRRVAWGGLDPDDGLTDDPRWSRDAAALGHETVVRHDTNGYHWDALVPVEARGWRWEG